MEYYGHTLCISVPELTGGNDPVMSYDAYKSFIRRNRHVRVRLGGAAGPALLAWHRLRDDIKRRYIEKKGDPEKQMHYNALLAHLKPDAAAASYFGNYQLEDGRNLPEKVQVEYTVNAIVLNAINVLANDTKARTRSLGNSTKNLWPYLSRNVNNLPSDQWPHSLPSNPIRLKEKLSAYLKEGYQSLIHRGYGNGNSRKVNDKLERLLLSLYCQSNLPFGEWVHDDYLRFIAAELAIVDGETGEMISRDDFYDERRQTYITVSKATIWNVINNPDNALIIDRMRNNRIDHITASTPFNHRHSPRHSLAKISADDRTLSRKTSDGYWLNAYAVFDVMSGAALSCVYSTSKPTLAMVWDCFREMFHTLTANSLPWPGELECENHLMREIEDELRAMFMVVNFTPAGLSRSKRAEHNIRSLKYGSERKMQEGIGRWNGKGVYKVKSAAKDEEYKQIRLPAERLIAEAKQAIAHHNSQPHPNQKAYPGKTRWQVLLENVHPSLGEPFRYKLFRYIGFKTATSIRNNDFVRVQYENYAIDSYDVLRRLKPNNYQVDAYYLPEPDGSIGEVYLYQDGQYLTRATLIERYNEAIIERTERDEQIRQGQARRQATFFKRENELLNQKISRRLELITTQQVQELEEVEAVVVHHTPINRDEVDLEAAFAKFNPEIYSEKSIHEV